MHILQDLRYALRGFRRSPLFFVCAILALALGIGANTAVFSVVNTILLRPLPYEDPNRLVVALHDGQNPVAPADFFDYRNSARSFEALAAAQAGGGNISGQDRAENIRGVRVTADLFALLHASPQLGRIFAKGEDQPSATPTVILSDALWHRDFGASRGVLGRKLTIDGVPHTVIGVMQAGFEFPPFWFTQGEMWTPLDLSARLHDRNGQSLRLFGRLRSGVTLQAAQAEMTQIAGRLSKQYPESNAGREISILPLEEKVVKSIRPTLLVLLGTVGLVLLIAAVNVSNLLLARATGRRREIAVRLAIGASRAQIVRQLLAESVLLGVLGGVAGLATGVWALDLLRSALPAASLPRQAELGLDLRVFAFAACLSLFTGVIAGLLPALQSIKSDVNEDLKDGNKGSTAASGTGRIRSALVVAEVALGLVLLTGAGLMIKTFVHMLAIDPGFQPHNVLAFEVSLAGTPYDKPGARLPAFDRITAAIESVGGVSSASAINHLPLAGDLWRLQFQPDDKLPPPPGQEERAAYRVVRPGYFTAMALPLVAGRDFNMHDDLNAPPVVIVNEALSHRVWGDQNPVGKTISLDSTLPNSNRLSVIGVVKNARQQDWTSPAQSELYVAYRQRPDAFGLKYLTFVVRTARPLDSVIRDVEAAVWHIDRDLPISRVQSMDQVVSNQLWRARVSTGLFSVFGAIALTLAALGIYAVISYQITRRTQEIGIRMALGADRAAVLRLMVASGMRPVMLGIGIGTVAAFLLTRGMASLLFEVAPHDPMILTAVVAALGSAGFIASVIPALRATRLDPVRALRHE